MSSYEDKSYGAILVDTCIFASNSLRLEKGLLGKLKQFKDSGIHYLLPDVIKSEVKSHLENKVKSSRGSLEKALNNAGDDLFFDGSELNEAKSTLIDSHEIEEVATNRLEKFIVNSGALVLECGDYVSVSELLQQYFEHKPPFAEIGKKKYEFPDAIVLLAIEKWAIENKVQVLAVAHDSDWKSYCDTSANIDYIENFSDALSKFNKATVPFGFLSLLTSKIDDTDDEAEVFIGKIRSEVERYLEKFLPEIEANSYFHWEEDGFKASLTEFQITDSNFKVIECSEHYIVIEANAEFTIDASGFFHLSKYDSIDRENFLLASISMTTEEQFTSEILINICGDLTGSLSDLSINQIEIVNPITSIDFGLLEPNCGKDN